MSTLSPESSFSLSRRAIFRLDVAFNPLCALKQGIPLAEGATEVGVKGIICTETTGCWFSPHPNLSICLGLFLSSLQHRIYSKNTGSWMISSEESTWWRGEGAESSPAPLSHPCPGSDASGSDGSGSCCLGTSRRFLPGQAGWYRRIGFYPCGNPRKGSEFGTNSSSWWFVNNSRYLFIY